MCIGKNCFYYFTSMHSATKKYFKHCIKFLCYENVPLGSISNIQKYSSGISHNGCGLTKFCPIPNSIFTINLIGQNFVKPVVIS